MSIKRWILFTASFVLLSFGKAQNKKTDSVAVAHTLNTLAFICENVDFTDPKTTELGTFYKAAWYIVYRGDNEKRNWKDFANYNNTIEKKGVDNACARINQTINQDSSYKIVQYFTEKESEGLWHILVISYKKKGAEKKVAYAFLKIKGRFGLGDIDQNYKQ